MHFSLLISKSLWGQTYWLAVEDLCGERSREAGWLTPRDAPISNSAPLLLRAREPSVAEQTELQSQWVYRYLPPAPHSTALRFCCGTSCHCHRNVPETDTDLYLWIFMTMPFTPSLTPTQTCVSVKDVIFFWFVFLTHRVPESGGCQSPSQSRFCF